MVGALIAAEAEEWVGTPFHWQASAKGRGCDCKGLIAGVARAVGRAEADSVEAIAADYGKFVPVPRLKAGLARLFDRVAERQPGDVLLLRMGGVAQHLAIYAPTETQPDRIIEAMPTGPGKVRPGRATAVRIDSVWRWRTTHADS
jgi:NlpC/P60 family putative phage cell wall peptidase